MKTINGRRALSALVFTAFLGACQDHHFVPYDKMGPLPEPPAPSKTGKAAPPQPQAPYQAGAAQPQPSQPAFTGVIASGVVEVAPEDAAALPSGWTLYIIARPAEGGPAVAAKRVDKPAFPLNFELTEQDIMVSQPKSGMKISVEARYDEDGDPITKGGNDFFGKAGGEFEIGGKNALIRLKRQTG